MAFAFRAIPVFLALSLCPIQPATAQLSTSADLLFGARIPASEIYGDCEWDEQGCADMLSVMVHRIGIQMQAPDELPRPLGMLPTPLLSTVHIGNRMFAGRCPVETLAAKLESWRTASEKFGETPSLGAVVPPELVCFNGGYQGHDLFSSLVFIWSSGQIVGWTGCKNGVCEFQYYPPATVFVRTDERWGIDVALISEAHVDSFLSRPGSALKRVMSFAPFDLRRAYNKVALSLEELSYLDD